MSSLKLHWRMSADTPDLPSSRLGTVLQNINPLLMKEQLGSLETTSLPLIAYIQCCDESLRHLMSVFNPWKNSQQNLLPQ
jgi:hypothetical protein